jgi:hypothetical protein
MSITLKNLNDNELLEYYSLYSILTVRERDRHVNKIDTKFSTHIVRLILECEMVMVLHDLDLEAHREILKSVRRGDWTLEEIENWFKRKEAELETLYIESTLPYSPDYGKLKKLLMNCLEAHFGSLAAYFNMEGSSKVMQDKLNRIRSVLEE